nr:hypothetical protein [Tanacetum cinerariifolium]
AGASLLLGGYAMQTGDFG